MSGEKTQGKAFRHYYVDESGDGILFGHRGKLLLGQPGIPRYFILGLLDVPEPALLEDALGRLRNDLCNDKYFKNVPSMRRTTESFHAKDDIPEVRMEVFRLLQKQTLSFSAIVKDMYSVYDYVRGRNAVDAEFRYHPDELYDHTARRLFRERLHKESAYEVCFARRGKSDRTRALAVALRAARDEYCRKHMIEANSEIRVRCANSRESAGLQASDYFLWALQRAYNRGEERFVEAVWSKYSLVVDVDDTRRRRYGEYYTQRHPLSLISIER